MQSELEFEWIRQFYIQGSHHYTLHAWWHEPIRELLRLWGELQTRLTLTLEVLKTASTFDFDSEFASSTLDKQSAIGEGKQTASSEKVSSMEGYGVKEGDGERRKDRKRWLKTLQRIECVDISSYDAVLESLRVVCQ